MPIKYDDKGIVKRPNKEMALTQEQLEHFVKSAQDVKYFAEHFYVITHPILGSQIINLYPYQHTLLENLQNNRFNIFMTSRQMGKACTLDTPIITPTGFTTMRDIEVGDVIYGKDGKEATVSFITEVMNDKVVYEIEFDDGEKIKACEEHLWEVSTTNWQRCSNKNRVLSTKELIPLYETLQNRSKPASIFIETCNCVDFKNKNVEIDPYVLGLWLGDGNRCDGRIICSIEDYEHYKEKLNQNNIEISDFRLDKRSDNTGCFNVIGLTRKIRLNNLKKNKHIPHDYIFNDKEMRLELLRGLMDSDGYCAKNGTCQFYQSDEELIDQVKLLLSTLGIKSKKTVHETKHKLAYRLTFVTRDFDVFSLERKLDRQYKIKNHPKNKRHYIKYIKKIDSEPVRCLQVDNEDHLFLCGKSLIPTHNTACSSIFLLWYAIFNKEKLIAILANKADNAKKILEGIKFAYENLPEYMKPGVEEYNAFNVKFDNGSEIICRATSADALRGYSASLLMLDEFAFVQPNIADEFWAANYPILSTGGSAVVVSTPQGTANLFYRLWKDAIDGNNSFVPFKVTWEQHPDRDENWYKETIKNIGKIKFNQEHNCAFYGSAVTLIDGEFIINKLKWEEPIEQPDDWSKFWDAPKPGRKYAISVDVSQGVGSDYSVANVFDITEGPESVTQVCCYRRNDINVPDFTKIVYEMATYWNNAYLIIETNCNLGEELQRTLFEEYEYENLFFDYETNKMGVYATRGNKPKSCQYFKELLEEGHIFIKDSQLIEELGYFEEVRKDVFKAKNSQGCFDDTVITCVWLSYFLKSKYFLDIKDSWILEESPVSENSDSDAYEKWTDFLHNDYEEVEENWLDKDVNGPNSGGSGVVWW